MSKYVLFGGPFLNVDGPQRGEQFGEVLDFSDDEAAALIQNGAAIIPQADFNALFSKADVLQYPSALSQQNAPDSFKANLRAAFTVFDKLRAPAPVVSVDQPSPTTEPFGASSAQPISQ